MDSFKKEIPKILYISDVPVANLYSGSAIMYNLFENFDKNKIVIYQGQKISVEKQLSDVQYLYHQPILGRLKHTRFNRLFTFINIIYNYFFTPRKLRNLIKESKPDVIITVVHGLLWIMAYEQAKRNKLPLAICIHDDINAHYPKNRTEGKILRRLFKVAYKSSYARFCISDLMRLEYFKEMNVDSTVIYPLQRKLLQPNKLLKPQNSNSITVVYAGTLEMSEYIDMLDNLAKALLKYKSRLVVFSNKFPELLKKNSNIIFRGFIDSVELQNELNKEADVLFVPFSFYGVENKSHLALPSKLVEYTSLYKPLLIWASEVSAIGKWFSSLSKIPGVIVSQNDNREMLDRAIIKLLDPDTRRQLSENAFYCGKDFFAYEKLQDEFTKVITNVAINNKF